LSLSRQLAIQAAILLNTSNSTSSQLLQGDRCHAELLNVMLYAVSGFAPGTRMLPR